MKVHKVAYSKAAWRQLEKKILLYANSFDHFLYLNNNEYTYGFKHQIAIGAKRELNYQPSFFDHAELFIKHIKTPVFGFWGYNLKNEIEPLSSNNTSRAFFEDGYFFEPQILIEIFEDHFIIKTDDDPQSVWTEIETILPQNIPSPQALLIKRDQSKKAYIDRIQSLKKHIEEGDIYEINYCLQHFCEAVEIDITDTYQRLNVISPTPFSVLLKKEDNFLISASPERFLAKKGDKVWSQPIKGTARRGKTKAEDQKIKETLATDEKEIAENLMIVDLVRNDLTKTALPGSINVDELFGVYSFRQWHQMISTISSRVATSTPVTEIIKNAFPMGSMTGAPKIMAMRLIEEYEYSDRNLFSGAVGYISPERNFDFNVIIRSILYNKKNKKLSFPTGSAITYNSDPEKEYQECLLKAEAILQCLND